MPPSVHVHEDGRGLGAVPSPADHRDLVFAEFRDPEIDISVPHRFGHRVLSERMQPWNMLGNGPDDTVKPGFRGCGCCVLADAGHATMLWSAEAGREVKFTGRNIVDAYSAVAGYKIGDDSTDNGTVPREALDHRRKVGIHDADGNVHRIGAYVALDLGNWREMMEAAYLLSAIEIAFDCPDYLFDQFDAGKPWTVLPGEHSSLGGHDVPVVGRWTLDYVTCISWGKVQRLSRGFFSKYVMEAWGVLSEEMVRDEGTTIEGLDLAALRARMARYGPVQG